MNGWTGRGSADGWTGGLSFDDGKRCSRVAAAYPCRTALTRSYYQYSVMWYQFSSTSVCRVTACPIYLPVRRSDRPGDCDLLQAAASGRLGHALPAVRSRIDRQTTLSMPATRNPFRE